MVVALCLVNFLQHLPDFKGIETLHSFVALSNLPCSTSLTSKGLRHAGRTSTELHDLAAPP